MTEAAEVGTSRGVVARVRGRSPEILVLLVALVARLGVIFRHGGIHGIIGYDCGVYFAGTDGLIHGRLPYRDFTMVQPPGITVVLTPFAALTNWMPDWHAFFVATLAFCLLGGINAVLVVVVCRRLGFGAVASGVGGLFYAVWYGSISGEFEVKLEPLGNLFLLVGLLLLLRAQRNPTRWASLVAGIALGLTLTFKIWWGVPVVLLVVWHAWRQRSVRVGVHTAIGASISVVVVYAPFFLADPSGMFSSVVTNQLDRPRQADTAHRILGLTTLPNLKDQFSSSTQAWAEVLFALATVAVLCLAWRASVIARALVVLVVAQLIVLFASPSWHQYYSDYIAVGLAVCVGAAASSAPGMRLLRLRLAPPLLLTAGALVIAALVTITATMAIRPFTGTTKLTRDVRNVTCVMAVNPTVLLRLDALTRGLEAGCPNWIDVSGHRYSLPNPDGLPSRRLAERELTTYLRSGDAAIIFGGKVPEGTAKAIKGDGVLARAGGHTVYRTRR